MMKMLYLECGMGAAGDMLAAALLDLYEDPEAMVGRLNALHLEGISYALERGHSCGVAAMRLHVLCHGEEEHEHEHEHGHEHGHGHEHEDGHGHEHAHHAHRHLSDIESMVDGMAVSARVRENIKQVYRRIAEAEGHAHGCEVGEVHFHEVGMLDAIGDVTAVCVMMDDLGIDRVMASPVHVGAGVVRCAHGTLPVPAPATAWILRDVPTYGGEIASELCTPTGAALIRHFAEGFGPQPVMRVARVGYGMGQKVFERMNCVRAFLGWVDDGQDRDGVVYEMSCNLDDMTAERMGYAGKPRPDGRLIWIHGASVGETLSALPLINKLSELYPAVRIMVTSGTLTSADLMAKRLPANAFHQFVPVDTPAAVKRFVDYDTISGLMAYDVVIERSDSGVLVAKLIAPVMRNVETEDSTFLEFPKGFYATVYEGDTAASAKISGNYGVMYEDDDLLFARDNVVVENIDSKETLETETLYWNQKTKKIYTRNYVKISSPDKVIFGDSLQTDENFTKRIIHGIRATLEIEDTE